MAQFTGRFIYQTCYAAEAIKETRQIIENLGLTVDNIDIVAETRAVSPKDWYEDYLFTLDAVISSDKQTEGPASDHHCPV